MAKSGLPGHVAGTTALPPTGDIRWPMSASRRLPPLWPGDPTPEYSIAPHGYSVNRLVWLRHRALKFLHRP